MKNDITTVEPREAVGKTIQAVRYESWDTDCKVLFTDGTFLVLQAQNPYDDGLRLSVGDHSQISDYDLRVLGVIDEAEHMRRCEAQVSARDEEVRLQRLGQWRVLNKEFAGTPDPPKPDCTCAICQAQGDGACTELTNLLDTTIGKPT